MSDSVAETTSKFESTELEHLLRPALAETVPEEASLAINAHGKEFHGSTEEYRRMCPYLGRLSIEDAETKIKEQAAEKATLDSIMDMFEAKQNTAPKPVISDAKTEIKPSGKQEAIDRTAMNREAEDFMSATEGQQEDAPKLQLGKSTTQIADAERTSDVLASVAYIDDYRDEARRLSAERLTDHLQRELEADILPLQPDMHVIKAKAVADNSNQVLEIENIDRDIAQPKERLAAPQDAVDQVASVISDAPAIAIRQDLLLEAAASKPDSLSTELEENVTHESEDVDEEYVEPEITMFGPTNEVHELFSKPTTEDVSKPFSVLEEIVNDESDVAMMLEDDATNTKEDVIRFDDANMLEAISALKSIPETDHLIENQFLDGIEVVEDVKREEVIGIINELMMILNEVKPIASNVDVAHQSIVEAPEANESIQPFLGLEPEIKVEIKELLTVLSTIEAGEELRTMLDELLNAETVDQVLTNLEDDNNYLQYLSKRLGTSEYLQVTRQTPRMVQRTIDCMHSMVGASTLQLYGLQWPHLYFVR